MLNECKSLFTLMLTNGRGAAHPWLSHRKSGRCIASNQTYECEPKTEQSVINVPLRLVFAAIRSSASSSCAQIGAGSAPTRILVTPRQFHPATLLSGRQVMSAG